MTEAVLDAKALARLRDFDTPTICNAVNMLAPEAPKNFTSETLICAAPDNPPMVGYAKTARMRGTRPSPLPKAEERAFELEYWAYVAAGPRPTISVMQDIDGAQAGYAALWGDVNATIHQGLGCVGGITSGCIRDIHQIPPGFQLLAAKVTPFGSWSHFVAFDCDVLVCGMAVRSGDLVHADRHGAVVIPAGIASRVADAADHVTRRERIIVDVAKRPGLTVDDIRKAYQDMSAMTFDTKKS